MNIGGWYFHPSQIKVHDGARLEQGPYWRGQGGKSRGTLGAGGGAIWEKGQMEEADGTDGSMARWGPIWYPYLVSSIWYSKLPIWYSSSLSNTPSPSGTHPYLVTHSPCLAPDPSYLVPHLPIWYPSQIWAIPTLTSHQSGILHSLIFYWTNAQTFVFIKIVKKVESLK